MQRRYDYRRKLPHLHPDNKIFFITSAHPDAGSFRINKETKHIGRVWQEESFDRALRREEALDAKIEYMIANPVRAGLVSTSAKYRWIWIDGLESPSTGGAPVPPSRWAV